MENVSLGENFFKKKGKISIINKENTKIEINNQIIYLKVVSLQCILPCKILKLIFFLKLGKHICLFEFLAK